MSSGHTDNQITDQKLNKISGMHDHIENALSAYFMTLGDHEPVGLYDLVHQEVDRVLLAAAMVRGAHNQTRVAKMLGVSRSTLRKKLALCLSHEELS